MFTYIKIIRYVLELFIYLCEIKDFRCFSVFTYYFSFHICIPKAYKNTYLIVILFMAYCNLLLFFVTRVKDCRL